MSGATYFIGVLQVKAYKVLQRTVSNQVKQYGLNPTQWFILGQIKEDKDVRTADLAEALGVDPPLITTLTDDLEAKGIIKKQQHTDDKRVRLLRLTSKGIKLTTEIEVKLQDTLKELIKGVSAKELEAYEKVLQTIVDNDLIYN